MQTTPLLVVKRTSPIIKATCEEAEITWVAIYLRVSSDGQARLGFGLDTQLEINQAYVARFPNFRVFGIYTDEGVTGTVTDRKDMKRLIRDAQVHPIKFVIVAYLNRQSRDEYVGYYLDNELKEVGVTLVSATQDPNPYDINLLARGVQRVVDADDRRKILAQTNNGRQLAAEAGFWTGGPAPFGYEIIGQGKKRSTIGIDKVEAACLLRAVELVVDEGMNVAEAATQLNLEGFRPRNVASWTAANLHKRLRAESTGGFSTFRKSPGEFGASVLTKVKADGSPALGAPVVRQLPEIITPKRHKLLLAALEKNSYGPRDPDNQYLLSGHIKGRCGGHYHGATGDSRRYVCSGKGRPKQTKCKDIALRADLLEETVWQELGAFFKDQDRLTALAEEWTALLPSDRQKHEQNVKVLETEVARQRGVLETLTQQLAEPDLDPDDAEIRRGSKAALLQAWKLKKTELAQAKAAVEDYDRIHADVTRVADLVRDTQVRIDTMTNPEKTVLLKLLRIEIRVVGDAVRADCGMSSPLEAWHRDENVLVPDDPDDALWESVADLLYTHERGLRSKAVPEERVRACLRAILHRLRTGCRWLDLPEEFVPGVYGHWSSISTMQYRWWQTGTWRRLVELMLRDADGMPIGTPPARPPLEIVGRLNPDLLEPVSIIVSAVGQASRTLSDGSKIFSFTLQVP